MLMKTSLKMVQFSRRYITQREKTGVLITNYFPCPPVDSII